MDYRNNILNELEEFAPSLAVTKVHMPYEVPVGYFISLSGNLIEHIVIFTRLTKTSVPYNLPNDYFTNLAENLLKVVKLPPDQSLKNDMMIELEELSPLLASIKRENIYSVPGDYFNTVSVDSISLTNQPSKVISLSKRINKWFTYSAAASVLIFFSLVSYLYINQHMKNVDKSPTIEQRLADLNDNEIIDYLKYDQPEDVNLNSIQPETDPDINHLLINTSDEEIQQYLDDANDDTEKNIKGI